MSVFNIEKSNHNRSLSTLSEQECLDLGFEKMLSYTIGNNFIYNLGRNRHLSISAISTPNEMLFISETDSENPSEINELICLHNYDYDGYLSKEKLKNLINSIGKTKAL